MLEEAFRTLDYKTVKWNHYLKVYGDVLNHAVGSAITICEIGVLDGGSLFLWRRFLGDKARIIGIDLNPEAKALEAHGFEIYIGDQSSEDFWLEFFRHVGNVDVLIDDGGHTNKQQIVTMFSCLHHINDGGIFLVEDTHASYMREFGNPCKYSFMNFAKRAIDSLNARNPRVSLPKDALSDLVYSISFFESIVVFHVDRRLCTDSYLVTAGSRGLNASDFRHHRTTSLYDSFIQRVFKSLPWFRRVVSPGLDRLQSFVISAALARENRLLRGRFHNGFRSRGEASRRTSK